MPLFPVEQVKGQAVGFYTSQLLSNGKILAFELGVGKCYIIEPDEYGSYRSARVRRVQDLPFTQLYGPTTIANNGNLVVHCGEYGTSHLGYTQMFNPETEKWTSYNVEIANHSLALLAKDGTILGSKRLPPYAFPNAAVTYSVSSNNSSEYGGSAAMSLNGGYRSGMETCQAMLPSDTANETNFAIAESHDPGQPAFLGQITYNESTGNIYWNRMNVTTQLRALYTSSPWFREYSATVNNTGRWCSTGDGPGGVKYEPGVLVYMSKLGKIVQLAGNGGIYAWSLSSGLIDASTTTRPATMPNTPLWSINNSGSVEDYKLSLVSQHFGVASGSSVGVTGTQIATAGNFQFTATSADHAFSLIQRMRFTISGNTPGPASLWVRLNNNTEWVKFLYTSVDDWNSTAVVTARGVTLAAWPGQVSVNVTSTSQVSDTRPSYDSRDGCATFLPNGDVLFAAGTPPTPQEGFNGNCRLLKWDGTSNVAAEVAADSSSTFNASEYVGSLFPLPDGTIWCGFGDFSKVYVPTTAEAIPLANSIPVITSAPTSFAAGSRFSLAGTGLTGVHEGGYWSEDKSPRSNFPIVRLRNLSNNYVYYCMTRDYTYRGIKPQQASSCNVHVPYAVPAGSYQMSVVVNGVSSAEMTVTVGGQSGGEPMFLNRKV